MTKRLVILGLLWILNSFVLAQGTQEGVFLRVKNQNNHIRIFYYDSALSYSLFPTEHPGIDSIFIEQTGISSIEGFTGFAPGKQFGLATLPGDSIEVVCNKAGGFQVRFLNNSPLHKLRQYELDNWSTVIDAASIASMKRYRQQKDLKNLLAVYDQAHERRQAAFAALYKDYTQHPYYQIKRAQAHFLKTYNVWIESHSMGRLDSAATDRWVDSLTHLANQPLLANQPIASNMLAKMLYRLSKEQPRRYTNRYWFEYVATQLRPGPIQKERLLYYVKSCKTPQWYDSLAARFQQLYPTDAETATVLAKYRQLKFLNLYQSTSCSVTDTAGNPLPFDSLVAQYRGKPVYIDFWASWCAPCLAEMPQSRLLRQRYANRVQFVYISVDDRMEQWLGGLRRNRLQPAEHYLLPNGVFVYKGTQLPIKGVPRHVLLDAEGNLVDDHAPGPGNQLLPKALESLIKR
jgi:thiol-disulfide isomerase/thioredoxin